jgi:hypothetical protein
MQMSQMSSFFAVLITLNTRQLEIMMEEASQIFRFSCAWGIKKPDSAGFRA